MFEQPSAADNFSLGVWGLSEGDWFDVRELSLFIGYLPWADYWRWVADLTKSSLQPI